MNFLGNRLTGSRGSVVKAAAAMAVLALEERAREARAEGKDQVEAEVRIPSLRIPHG